MKEEFYAGIDLSFTETGIVLLDQNSKIVEEMIIGSDKKDSYEKRIYNIYDRCRWVSDVSHLKMINIEGLSYGSIGKIAELGALHYFFRVKFFENKSPYIITTPTELKKFITGKGNSKKEIMIKEIYKKWGADFNNNNLADAYALAKFIVDKKETKNEQNKQNK